MFRLPVYITDDEKETLEKCGIDVPIEQHETTEMVFFRIDALEPLKRKGEKERCVIHLGGDTFSTPLTMEEVLKLINP